MPYVVLLPNAFNDRSPVPAESVMMEHRLLMLHYLDLNRNGQLQHRTSPMAIMFGCFYTYISEHYKIVLLGVYRISTTNKATLTWPICKRPHHKKF